MPTPFDNINTKEIYDLDGAACFGEDPLLWDTDVYRYGHPRAVEICETCTVRDACATSAPKDWGIWGALMPHQRRAVSE